MWNLIYNTSPRRGNFTDKVRCTLSSQIFRITSISVTVNPLSAAVKYVCEYKVYETNIKNLYRGALVPTYQFLINMSNCEGVDNIIKRKQARNILSKTLLRLRDVATRNLFFFSNLTKDFTVDRQRFSTLIDFKNGLIHNFVVFR